MDGIHKVISKSEKKKSNTQNQTKNGGDKRYKWNETSFA